MSQRVEAVDDGVAFAEPGRTVVTNPPAPPRRRPRGDGHSRAVAWLKRVLPAIGAALLLLVAAWPRIAPLLHSVRLTFSAIDPREARELDMLNPRYTGTDRLNRPFVITAAVGRQLPNHSDLMALERPRAVMIVHGGAKVVLTAKTAMYQSQTQLLDLFGDVTLTHQNGTRFMTERAHADVANSTAEGDVAIEGHGPSGDIWGRGFRVRDKGDTIIFTGRSHAILRGSGPGKPTRTAPEPPAEILTTAKAIEDAAVAPNTEPPIAPPMTKPAAETTVSGEVPNASSARATAPQRHWRGQSQHIASRHGRAHRARRPRLKEADHAG